MVHVLEEDDGSGWVKVVDNQGGKGLVPASYIKFSNAETLPPSPVHSRSDKSSKKYGMHPVSLVVKNDHLTQYTVRGLYDYQAQGSDELGITEGELIELSGGPNGGQNYADGWWEGNTSFCPLHRWFDDLWI